MCLKLCACERCVICSLISCLECAAWTWNESKNFAKEKKSSWNHNYDHINVKIPANTQRISKSIFSFCCVIRVINRREDVNLCTLVSFDTQHYLILTFWKHFLYRVREVFEVYCDRLARWQVVERMISRILHIGQFDSTRRDLTVYGSVIVISLHDRYRRQSRDRVQVGLLLEENIHGLCVCRCTLADVFALHRQTFARAIRIVPRLIDPIVSRAEQLMCEDAWSAYRFLNYPRYSM